jgi:phage terminase small subunit
MGDIVSNSVAKPISKYTPPSKRTGSDGKIIPVVEKIDMSDKNFPSLGSLPVKVAKWGQHVATVTPVAVTPVVVTPEVSEKKETLSDKIKEKIRLDAIAEELGAKKEQPDLWKMTDEELAEAGWQRLRVNSARDRAVKGFTNQDNPYLAGFIEEADTGMSFEEYVHYKVPMSSREPTPLPEDDEDYSDVEDY